jgi:hypothetical protein
MFLLGPLNKFFLNVSNRNTSGISDTSNTICETLWLSTVLGFVHNCHPSTNYTFLFLSSCPSSSFHLQQPHKVLFLHKDDISKMMRVFHSQEIQPFHCHQCNTPLSHHLMYLGQFLHLTFLHQLLEFAGWPFFPCLAECALQSFPIVPGSPVYPFSGTST